MIEYRTHYAPRGNWSVSRCGIAFPKNSTYDPTKVTCGNCKRLLGKEVK